MGFGFRLVVSYIIEVCVGNHSRNTKKITSFVVLYVYFRILVLRVLFSLIFVIIPCVARAQRNLKFAPEFALAFFGLLFGAFNHVPKERNKNMATTDQPLDATARLRQCRQRHLFLARSVVDGPCPTVRFQ